VDFLNGAIHFLIGATLVLLVYFLSTRVLEALSRRSHKPLLRSKSKPVTVDAERLTNRLSSGILSSDAAKDSLAQYDFEPGRERRRFELVRHPLPGGRRWYDKVPSFRGGR
jgi:hypothetical protein